jgi:hypothetical protein
MLVQLILDPIFWVITTLLSLIPTFEISQSVLDSVSPFLVQIANLNYFFPVSDLFQIFSLILTFYLFKFGVSSFNWLIAKIPTIN